MKIAVLGTGLMGYPIAEKLLQDDFEVIAYNRTRSKAEPLTELGGVIANSSKQAIDSADTILAVLTDAKAIEEVVFDCDTDAFSDRTLIQMSTIAPNESRNFDKQIRSLGGKYLEAPVLGNKHHARVGKLQIMIGGTESGALRYEKLFASLGTTFFVGPVGSAASLKLALNHLIASLTASFSLSLELVRRNEVAVETFMDVLRESALYSKQFDKKLTNMLESDYSDPNFPTQHLLKDVDLAIDAADTASLETSAVRGVRQVILNAIDKGFEQTDYSSLFEGIKIQKENSYNKSDN